MREIEEMLGHDPIGGTREPEEPELEYDEIETRDVRCAYCGCREVSLEIETRHGQDEFGAGSWKLYRARCDYCGRTSATHEEREDALMAWRELRVVSELRRRGR